MNVATYEDATSLTQGGIFSEEPDELSLASAQWSGVIPLARLSQWKIETIKEVLQLVTLPNNWDSYGSPPPSQEAVNSAVRFLLMIPLDDLPGFRISPVSGGGIQLAWRKARRELEAEILPDGSIEFLKSEGGLPIEEGELSASRPTHVKSIFSWLISG